MEENSVRRSIGEWESAGQSASLYATASTQQTTPENRKAAQVPAASERRSGELVAKTSKPESPAQTTQPGKFPTVRKLPSPAPKYYDNRVAEAKACLIRGKLHMNSSRNTKTDIKTEVLGALERLYQLVREAEAERKKEGKDVKLDSQSNKVKTAPADVTFTVDKETSRLVEKMEEHTRRMEEANKRIEEMVKENNELLKKNDRETEVVKGAIENIEKASYASIVASNKTVAPRGTAPERTALHSIAISSEKEEETGEEVLEKVRKAVDAKEGWVLVERVRKAKDRKIIMGCRTQEERKKVKERLEEAGAHLVVEEMENKNPLIILRDVLLIHSDEDILKALKNQNREIFHGLDDEECQASVKYRRRARNPLTGHIVLSVSPRVWKRSTEGRRLRVDLQSVRVEDQSPLVQCTRCLGYGHGRRFCKEPADLCSHCAGPHLKVDCPDQRIGEPPTCRNCTLANRTDAKHNAFSKECGIRRKWDDIARASIAYC